MIKIDYSVHRYSKIDILTALSIIGSIQLALRHPAYTGPSAELARRIASDLEIWLEQVAPDVAAIASMGWNPDFDIHKG
jgi:hypothetical protein